MSRHNSVFRDIVSLCRDIISLCHDIAASSFVVGSIVAVVTLQLEVLSYVATLFGNVAT